MSPSTALDDLLTRLRQLGLDDEVSVELAAVRDELDSTVRQLRTANDEVRASTEELEAIGDELARAAGELVAVNEEIEQRAADVERVTSYLQSVIDSLPGAVLLVDVDQRVRAWSDGAARRWGQARSEVLGRPLGRLDLAGMASELASEARAVIAGEERARAAGSVPVTQVCAPLRGADGAVEGAVLIVDAD